MPSRRKAAGDCVAFMSFPRRHGPTALGSRPALWVTIPESGGGDCEKLSRLFPTLQPWDSELQAGFWGPAQLCEMCLGAAFCGCLGLVPVLAKAAVVGAGESGWGFSQIGGSDVRV